MEINFSQRDKPLWEKTKQHSLFCYHTLFLMKKKMDSSTYLPILLLHLPHFPLPLLFLFVLQQQFKRVNGTLFMNV